MTARRRAIIGKTAEWLYQTRLEMSNGRTVTKERIVKAVAAEFRVSRRTVENAWQDWGDKERAVPQLSQEEQRAAVEFWNEVERKRVERSRRILKRG